MLRPAASYCLFGQWRSQCSVPMVHALRLGASRPEGHGECGKRLACKAFCRCRIPHPGTSPNQWLSRLQLGSVAGKNSSWCRRINSSRAFRTIADGSRGRATVRFRQIHSSKAFETSCCLVMPRYWHCFVNHSNCSEVTTMRSSPPDRSGSSGGDGCHSSFRTYQIAAER